MKNASNRQAHGTSISPSGLQERRGATAALPYRERTTSCVSVTTRFAGSEYRSVGVLVEPPGDPGQENLLRNPRARPFRRAAHVPSLRIDPCVLGTPALEQQERIAYRHLRVARAVDDQH